MMQDAGYEFGEYTQQSAKPERKKLSQDEVRHIAALALSLMDELQAQNFTTKAAYGLTKAAMPALVQAVIAR